MLVTRLLLVRHGETAWNAAGRFQGHTDVRLSPHGRQQAAALARLLAAEPVHVVYASDLQRAWETALILAAPSGLLVQQEPRLREITFGQWEGLTLADLQQHHATALVAWRADPMQVAPPGGETLAQVSSRVHAVLASLIATGQEHTVALVAHGGSLRVLLCLALGLPPQAYRQFSLAPGSLSELYIDQQDAVLTRLNDTHHLSGVGHGS
jgi:phosphoserine phosphatase